MRACFAAILAACLNMPVQAQHNHDRHHSDYLNWSSTKTHSCCSNQDCGTVENADLRETSSGTQIRIEDQWCPVLREHYLIRGKSPDWNVSHACIGNSEHWQSRPPCERLLCFSGKGGF